MTTTTPTNPVDLRTATELVELLDKRTFRCGSELIAATDLDGTGWPLTALQHAVYTRLYLGLGREAPDPYPADRRLATAREDPLFVKTLSAADGGRRRWEGGWRCAGSDPRGVFASSDQDGVRLRCAEHEVRPSGASAGEQIEVSFPTERRFVSPGFYLTGGLAGSATRGTDVLRWYLNVPAGDAARLLHVLVNQLDSGQVPFSVKTLNDPATHPRPDAMVLYSYRRLTPDVAQAVRNSLQQSGVVFREPVPAFTRQLAPGVAIADEPDDPGRPVSFGQHRSLLLARGVISAGERADPATRWTAVGEEFRRAGLDPDRPHLGPRNGDVHLETWGWE